MASPTRQTPNTPSPREDEAMLDAVLEVFEPRSAVPLGREDARQAAFNLAGAFSLLLQWKRARISRLLGAATVSDEVIS